MRLFIIFYLAVQCGWADYYNSSSYGSSKNSSSSSEMSLNLQKIDIRMEKFITAAEMKRKQQDGADEQIEGDWYKRDENNELIKGKNFQDNILNIMLQQLRERFGKSETSRSEMVENILLYLNEFISERFIPPAYHAAIKKIFSRAQDLQNKPAPLVTSIVFKELSEAAQKAFRDGKRVQASGLARAPAAKDNMRADPLLVELLFMQQVWDAQKRCSTRQELLNSIEKIMATMEQLFGNDSAYTVGTFSSLRSTLVEETQKESPLPELIKYIISQALKDRKTLEAEFKETFHDTNKEEWEEIIKAKAEPAVSIWLKKDIQPQESEDAKRERLQKEAKKKEKKNKKNKFKENLKQTEENALDSAKNKAIETAKGTFDGAINKVFGSLKGGFANFGGSLGGIFG